MPKKIHITQDEYGFWFMSLEEEDGTLKLLAHHFTKPDHLIQEAHEMAASVVIGPEARFVKQRPRRRKTTGMIVLADTPRKAVAVDPAQWPADYQPPQPKKAGIR